MKRTNIVIDEKLTEEAKRLSGVKTTRAVVDRALREFVESQRRLKRQHRILRLLGKIQWEGDLDAMRRMRTFE